MNALAITRSSAGRSASFAREELCRLTGQTRLRRCEEEELNAEARRASERRAWKRSRRGFCADPGRPVAGTICASPTLGREDSREKFRIRQRRDRARLLRALARRARRRCATRANRATSMRRRIARTAWRRGRLAMWKKPEICGCAETCRAPKYAGRRIFGAGQPANLYQGRCVPWYLIPRHGYATSATRTRIKEAVAEVERSKSVDLGGEGSHRRALPDTATDGYR